MKAARLKNFLVESLLGLIGTQKYLEIQLDITNACNLACVHCYHDNHANTGALSFEGWKEILDQYEALRGKLYLQPSFVLCGGEPTVSPLFLPMLDELDSRWPGVRITVLTNATRLTPGFVQRLRRFNVGFQISLDGPDADRHDLVRGKGNFAQALLGLSNLQATGLNATFLATLSYRSSRCIEEFFDTAARNKAEQMNFTRFIPQGAGHLLQESREDRRLSSSELRAAYEAILKFSRKSGVKTNTNLPLFHLLDPERGANGKAGFQGLVVDYQGNLKVSSRTGAKLGNVRSEGLEHLFLEHPIMTALRNRRIDGCGTCAHYAHCGGDRNASFVATGSFLAKDPECWLDTTEGR
jgi:radical SAM protein with 4Fe4S-binding SPASM domain